MRLTEALDIIENGLPSQGYVVVFTIPKTNLSKSDYYPAVRLGEEPFVTQVEAINSSIVFAAQTIGVYTDIYVADARTFEPVDDTLIKNK